jgi:4'-phosphopantetheinyl transferase
LGEAIQASDISDASEWSAAPQSLTLARDEVHVWRVGLNHPGTRVGELRALLSREEGERAARFHFEKDRAHFIVARGVLRTLLGLYLGSPPAELGFVYSPFGKPALAHGSGAHPVRFNVSHSCALALYAFARGREVGVDVEHARADFAGEDIAARFFSAREVAALRAVEPDRRTEAFFNCWTRKEAYIKAIGEGLSHPLDSFAVSLSPGEPAALLHSADASEPPRWSFRELKPAPGYAAALVVEGHDWRLRRYDWQASAGGA